MIDKNTAVELLKISSNIIEVIDDRDEMDNGDFQGCIEAQVMTAYHLGKKLPENFESVLANNYPINTFNDTVKNEIVEQVTSLLKGEK